jgi:hypothetical protein
MLHLFVFTQLLRQDRFALLAELLKRSVHTAQPHPPFTA